MFFPSKLNSDLYISHQKKDRKETEIKEEKKGKKLENFTKKKKESSKLKAPKLRNAGQGLKSKRK